MDGASQDDIIPLSQVQNEAFESNQALRQPIGPTSYAGLNLIGKHAANGTAKQRSYTVVDGNHGKLINDPIHGAYRLDPVCTHVFDTRQFQRLRRLKQLGLTYFVFPGASHNRFEHSLGVAHLAYRFANQLWKAQGSEELGIDRGDIRVVELAGLCHDLGHGPYSHVFEREFLKRKGITNWDHEDMSSKMLSFIIDENHIECISSDEVRRVQDLITAGHSGGSTSNKPKWLGEIVANGRNNIDVDKFDYLERDAKCCGVKISCDFTRIMQFSKVIDDEICYKDTEYMNLYELFHSRAAMHRNVYTHRKAKAVEFMVVDALVAADPVLKISERIDSPAEFQLLDDSLLEKIENFELIRHLLNIDEDQEKIIQDAQKIVERLRKRNLYKYVTDVLIPQEAVDRGQWTAPTEMDIVNSYNGTSQVKLQPDDVILQETRIDYSMKNTNPLDHVNFFDYLDSNEKKKLKDSQISSMVVANFEDRRLRVYSRKGDTEHVHAVHDAFRSWVRNRFGSAVETSTPAKQIRKQQERYDDQQRYMPVLGGGNKRARSSLFGSQGTSQGTNPHDGFAAPQAYT